MKQLVLAVLVAGIATAAAAADANGEGTPVIWTEHVFQTAARATVEAHLLQADAGGVTLTTPFGRIHAASLVAPLPYSFGSRGWQQLPNALTLLGMDMPFHHYPRPDAQTYIDAKRDDEP